MYKSIKRLLWIIIFISVSILLIPTIIKVFGIDLGRYDILHSLMANSQGIYAVISLSASIGSATLLLLINDKERKARIVLTEAVSKDAIWDIDTLTYHTRMVFYKVQSAWNNNDITVLQDYFTPEFKVWFKEQLKNKTAGDDQDATINFDITDTNIICCQDFLNNDKDRYEGYIQGNIIDAGDTDDTGTDEQEGEISTGNEDTGQKKFSEVYHFVRSQNDWLLNKIDFKISIWGLLTERNKFEQ